MTFVVHPSTASTSASKAETSDPWGRYTSKSPLTFIEDFPSIGQKPSGFDNDFLQSTSPDSQEKKAVTTRHRITVITGNFVNMPVKSRSDDILRN